MALKYSHHFYNISKYTHKLNFMHYKTLTQVPQMCQVIRLRNEIRKYTTRNIRIHDKEPPALEINIYR